LSNVPERTPERPWLRELALGRGPAWEGFIQISRPAVAHLGTRLTIPWADREDLVQEIALRAWDRLSSGRGLIPRDDGDLRGWILLLTHDVCVERFRKSKPDEKKRPPQGPPSYFHPPEHIQGEDLEHFKAILQPVRRPDWYRVVWLRCVNDWSIPEISRETGSPEATIRKWWQRAVGILRPRLCEPSTVRERRPRRTE
jgi:DNA-directed RNA polymerase specialized sigma24 family protein